MKDENGNKIDITEFSSNDLDKTSSFTDIMTRSERKRREREKNEAADELKEQTIAELKKVLEFDDDNENKPKNNKKKKKKENKEEKIKAEKQAETKNDDELKKVIKKEASALKKLAIGLCTLAFIAAFLCFCYFVYKTPGMKWRLAIIALGGMTIFALMILTLAIFGKDKARYIAGSLIFTGIILLFTLVVALKRNMIELPFLTLVPNFQGEVISEALNWANKNGITVKQTFEASDSIAEFHIISQSVAANTRASKIKEITFAISNGPNYDKVVIIPNMVGYNIDDALKIINDNFLNNVTIDFELNNSVKKDTIISQSHMGEMRRSDPLTILASLGTEADLVPTEMADLKNKTLFEATLWLKRHGIKYNVQYEFSSTVPRNQVLSQSPLKGTTVDPKTDTVTLIVSKGKEIIVPDFTNMTVLEATNWIIENKLKVEFKEKYDNEFALGAIVETNYQSGAKVEEGTTIILTTSKGKLKMEEFTYLTDFRAWANELNLAFEEEAIFSDKENGMIISTTPKAGEAINVGTPIKVVYSKGKAASVPDFINKTQAEANSLCNKAKLKCSFTASYNDSTPAGKIYRQSMSKGSSVPEGTSITLYLSNGPKPSVPAGPTCDTNITETVYLTAGNDGEQTKSIILRAYPNIKWNFQMVTSCSNGSIASGTICNASQFDGKNLNHCDTYTIQIVK